MQIYSSVLIVFSINILPDTRYFIDKLFGCHDNIEYHAVCPTCDMYVGKFKRTDRTIFCDVCKINVNLKDPFFHNYYVILDIEHEVSQLIENNSDYYNDIMFNRQEMNNNEFRDIYDGHLYKSFVKSLPDDQKYNYLTATFNTDGSPVFKSANASVNPLYTPYGLVIANLK